MASDLCETPAGAAAQLKGVDAVLIPGGFGIRGIEGKVGAIRHARERRIPTLGLCLGLQCMAIEVARDVAGVSQANSAEFDPQTPDPVIATMPDQVDIVAGNADLGGTMRLGAYPAVLTPGSLVAEAYGSTEVSERHRHRYEVNNAYRDALNDAGLVISGTSPDGRLVEFVELPRELHPFFVATQAHPELKSRPTRPHPLFAGVRRRGHPLQRRGATAGRARRTPSTSAPCPDERRCSDEEFPVPSAPEHIFSGHAFEVRVDQVEMPDGTVADRDIIAHLGAVGVLALDPDDNVTIVRQYRPAVRQHLLELPAGLLDVSGEPALETAKRELYEEAGADRRGLAGAHRPAHLAGDVGRVHPDLPGPADWQRCRTPSGSPPSTKSPP